MEGMDGWMEGNDHGWKKHSQSVNERGAKRQLEF